MALSHIHKYLSRIRWAKIFLNKINLHRSLLPVFNEASEWKGWKELTLISGVLHALWTVFFFFFWWSQTIFIRFTGHACGKFGFLAFISIVSESLSLGFDGNTFLWSFLGDSCILRVENHCCRMIIIALIVISYNNYYPSMLICGFCKRLANTVVCSLTREPLPDKP